jgi:metal-responsive CopG/Arc/MetJ family transcriptional regulator
MKTAVSIPDDVFEQAERLARRGGRSRSELYSAALRDYVARHAPEDVTDAMNRVCDDLQEQHDEFLASAGRRLMERAEW